MRRPIPGTNMAIFFLFFGIAMLDALRSHAWMRVTFWIGVAAIFLFVDLGRKSTPGDSA